MYTVNVSSVQDFMQCRFRWWCKWVMNRVPANESPALGFGKLLHTIFEDHLQQGVPLVDAAARHRASYIKMSKTMNPSGQFTAQKVVTLLDDLWEALPLWKDSFGYDMMLECEKPFELVLPEYSEDVLWRGRPDFIGVSTGRIWHRQNRGLAASMNFGTYLGLAKRHYHEHLYAEYASRAYADLGYEYGGTEFNLVRKLKYRTNVGKKNEKTKTAAEMFFSMPMSIKLDSPLHRSVMMSMYQHVKEMVRVENEWQMENRIPAPNEKMNGGFSGSTLDPYFRVLIGEISLTDNTVFKDREDTYAQPEESENA